MEGVKALSMMNGLLLGYAPSPTFREYLKGHAMSAF
jgi:hypothetical protein